MIWWKKPRQQQWLNYLDKKETAYFQSFCPYYDREWNFERAPIGGFDIDMSHKVIKKFDFEYK